MSSSIARKTGWNAVAGALAAISRFGAAVVAARELGPTGMGNVVLLLWMAEMATLVFGLGLGNTATRFSAELSVGSSEHRHGDLMGWLARRYLGSLLIGAFLITSLPISRDQLGNGGFGSAAIIFVLILNQSAASFAFALLAGRQRFDLTAKINAVSGSLLVAGVSIGAMKWGPIGALAGYICGATVPSFYLLREISLWGSRERLPPVLRQRILKYTVYTWLAALISAFVWSRIDLIFLERYRSPTEVGHFAVALSMASVTLQLGGLFSGALMPHFAQLIGEGNRAALEEGYNAGTRLVALVVFPLSFGVAALSPYVVPLLFGVAYTPSVIPTSIVAALGGLAFANVGSALLYAMERAAFISAASLFGAVIALVGCIFLIPTFGTMGAAVVRAIVQFSMIGLGTWYIAVRIGIAVPFGSLARTAVASSLCAVVASIVVILGSGWTGVVLATGAGATAYLFGIRFTGALDAKDAARLSRMLGEVANGVAQPGRRLLAWLSAEHAR